MSNFKKSMNSEVLKEKFSNLLERLDRSNTSKMIIERHYSNLASLDIEQSKRDAYTEIQGKSSAQNNSRNLFTASTINEGTRYFADPYLLQRISILESACKDLKVYDWMKPVGQFINETREFLLKNEIPILLERIIFELETDKNGGYFKKALEKLVEAANSENPIFYIVENLHSEKWIPKVKNLLERCESLKGSVTGQNPNFKINKVYSPVEFVNESEKYVFFSKGKLLELDGNVITESKLQVSESFIKLVRITESAKFGNRVMRLYPNPNAVLDIDFNGEAPKVSINNKLVESTDIATQLIAGGYVKYYEKQKTSEILHAIEEGRNIKELDFAYQITSNLFEGISATIFNLGENIYIQKVNPGMKENSFILAESAEDAVNIVKDFMNYDITNSVAHLLENEKSESEMRAKEIAKIEGRIKFLIESCENLKRSAKINGIEKSDRINAAISLLENQISEQHNLLSKITGKFILESCTVGQEYKINGKPGWIYQGETDGVHIFNQKDGKSEPMTFDEVEWEKAHKTKQIEESGY